MSDLAKVVGATVLVVVVLGLAACGRGGSLDTAADPTALNDQVAGPTDSVATSTSTSTSTTTTTVNSTTTTAGTSTTAVHPTTVVEPTTTTTAVRPEPVSQRSSPMLIPAGEGDPALTCLGMSPFPASALDSPVGVEQEGGASVAALREWSAMPGVSDFVQPGEWRRLLETDALAVFAAGPPGDMAVATFEFDATTGRWGFWQAAFECRSQVVYPDGLGSASWSLDPAYPPPGPDDDVLHVLVTEDACAGAADLGGRVVGPDVIVTSEAVIVAFAATPLVVDGVFACPGNPPLATEVLLDAPLGHRVLLDGVFWPSSPPTAR